MIDSNKYMCAKLINLRGLSKKAGVRCGIILEQWQLFPLFD